MKKNLSKAIAGTLVVSTVLTSTTNKVEACDSAAILEIANETAMVCPYVAPLVVTGSLIVTSITTIIGIKQDAKEEVIYRSYSHLPDHWKKNTWVEKLNPNGKVIQRRYYGSDGLPVVDYDLSHHGFPEDHPKNFGGAHKHLYNNQARRVKDRRQKGIEMTQEEYDKYIKNFNEYAEKMKVRYIEDAK